MMRGGCAVKNDPPPHPAQRTSPTTHITRVQCLMVCPAVRIQSLTMAFYCMQGTKERKEGETGLRSVDTYARVCGGIVAVRTYGRTPLQSWASIRPAPSPALLPGAPAL